MLVWDAVRAFTKDYLSRFYKNKKDIEKDFELQNWINAARDDGKLGWFASWDNEIETLTDYVAAIVWTASGQHAAVNYLQVGCYACCDWLTELADRDDLRPLLPRVGVWPSPDQPQRDSETVLGHAASNGPCSGSSWDPLSPWHPSVLDPWRVWTVCHEQQVH